GREPKVLCGIRILHLLDKCAVTLGVCVWRNPPSRFITKKEESPAGQMLRPPSRRLFTRLGGLDVPFHVDRPYPSQLEEVTALITKLPAQLRRFDAKILRFNGLMEYDLHGMIPFDRIEEIYRREEMPVFAHVVPV